MPIFQPIIQEDVRVIIIVPLKKTTVYVCITASFTKEATTCHESSVVGT